MTFLDLKPGDFFEFADHGFFPIHAKMKTKTGYVVLEGPHTGHQQDFYLAPKVKLLDVTISWKEKFPTKTE